VNVKKSKELLQKVELYQYPLRSLANNIQRDMGIATTLLFVDYNSHKASFPVI